MKPFAVLTLLSISLLDCGEQPTAMALANKIRCADVGKRWFEPRAQEIRGSGITLMRPEFAYNRSLDTCLCMYGTLDLSNHMTNRQCAVWDVLANREVASFGSADGQLTSEMNEKQFDSTATKLMGTEQSCSSSARWTN
jgi:hypothetical protein